MYRSLMSIERKEKSDNKDERSTFVCKHYRHVVFNYIYIEGIMFVTGKKNHAGTVHGIIQSIIIRALEKWNRQYSDDCMT